MLTNERDTETRIDTILKNKGWIDDPKNPKRTVWKQGVKTEKQRIALDGKRPDFVLYANEKGDKPLAVIEAKAQGKNVESALDQGIFYAEKLQAPIVFATDGNFTKSFHIKEKQPLFLNEEEVQELLDYQIAIQYLNLDTNKVNTLDKKVVRSRGELIGVFSKANDLLREEGLQAGLERFSEFSNLLFLKIFSEMEDVKKQQGKPFNIKGYALWDSFKDEDPEKLLRFLNEVVIRDFSNEYGSDIFKPLSIKNPDNLKEIIDSLSELQLSDTNADVKGDAFEYFIKAYSASNPSDLGEIFTPRHIVRTMVKLLDPKLGESVYDPFCGTGGMLVEAFKHMIGRTAQKEENLKILQEKTFYGTELTKTAKIAKMNMIIAGDGHSNIIQGDSFHHPVDQQYDVIITNYPFAQKTRYGELYDVASRNGDVIAPQHCFRSLKDGGRMAFIAPEGFLFRQDRALKQVREYLLNNANLKSVISLPQGCFLPYNGVKTSILYFDEVRTGKTKNHFWFFDIKNDGFTLDKRRSKVEDKKNDLDTVLSERNNEAVTEEYLRDQGIYKIEMKDVKEGNYSLACKQLVKDQNVTESEWPMVELGEVCISMEDGDWIESKNQSPSGVRLIQTGNIGEGYFLEKKDNKRFISEDTFKELKCKPLKSSDILISRLPDPVGRCCFAPCERGKMITSVDVTITQFDQTKVLLNYFIYISQSEEYKNTINKHLTGSTRKRISKNNLKKIKIPLPPIEFQKTLIEELDHYQKIIDGCQQVMDNYKPHVEIDPSWEMVELGEVCSIIMGQSPDSKFYNRNKNGVEFHQGNICFSDKLLKESKVWTEKYNKVARKDSIVMSVRAPVGKLNITPRDVAIGRGLCSIENNSKLLKNSFLFYMLSLNKDKILSVSQGSTFDNINKSQILKLKIPLPPLETQQKIVKEINQEQEAIDHCKWLIEKYKKKTQDRIGALWCKKTS